MRITVIGGSGLIGSQVTGKLSAQGNEVVAASLTTGVNTLTGEGLAEALNGASVVIDVSNSPSFEEKAVMEFFQTSTRNLIRFAATAGVRHYVALSVVGADRLPGNAYMRAKVAQEKLIKGSSIPFSIVRATQFFEFLETIVESAWVGDAVRLPPVAFQPMASADVADAVAAVAVGEPVNEVVETAGPERYRFDEVVRQTLRACQDRRQVVTDPKALYFGSEVSDMSLVPMGNARLGTIRLEEWVERAAT